MDGFDQRSPHTGHYRALEVKAERPAHLTFGPNGKEVVAIIDRVRAFDGTDLDRMLSGIRRDFDVEDMRLRNHAEWSAEAHGYGLGAKGAAAAVYHALYFGHQDHRAAEGFYYATHKLAQAGLATAAKPHIDESTWHMLMAPWRQIVGNDWECG